MGCRETSFTSVREFTIRDTHFEQDSPVILDSVLNATIINSSIINGSKLLVYSSTLTIKTALFSNLTATDGYFDWIQDPYGGAIRTENSNITIEQCVFLNNSLYPLNSSWGGAVYANNTRLHVIDSNFTGNSATETGGAISAENTLMQITNSQFSNNIAIEGGVLYITGNYIAVNISQSTFDRNAADVTGGTLYINGNNSEVFIDKSQFLNSRAKEGGILRLTGSKTSIHVNTSVFSNSRATVMGGALQILGDYINIDVDQCHFSSNTAGTEGGAAVYLKGYQSVLRLIDSTFSDNLAARCAVLQASHGQELYIQFINSRVTNNTAHRESIGDGTGGVACLKQASIQVINSSFSLNKASGNAGVLYTENSSLSIVRSSFDGNKAGLNGGVIYWYAETPHVSTDIDYSNFSNNLAFVDGAVMYVNSSGSQVTVTNSTFAYNNATERGAAIAIFGSQLYFDQNFIFDNYEWIINACTSNVTASDDLVQIVDPNPNNSSCSLYDERQGMPMTTASFTGSTPTEANATPAGPTSSSQATTTPAGTEITTMPGTNDTPGLTAKPTTQDSSRTEDHSAVPTIPNVYVTAIYTTLGIAIVVCVLLALLYIVVLCIVMYLCGVFKSKKRLVDNPYVYVPMKENETNADNEITPQQ